MSVLLQLMQGAFMYARQLYIVKFSRLHLRENAWHEITFYP